MSSQGTPERSYPVAVEAECPFCGRVSGGTFCGPGMVDHRSLDEGCEHAAGFHALGILLSVIVFKNGEAVEHVRLKPAG